MNDTNQDPTTAAASHSSSEPVPTWPNTDAGVDRFRATIHRVGLRSASSVASELRALLELGCDEFGMSLGLLTAAEGEHIRVVDVVGLTDVFHPDDICGTSESYCGETLRSKRPLAIDHAAQSSWRHHRAYANVGLESYLGSPLRLGGELYGTLCFLNPKPREKPFGSGEFERLRLLVERAEAILDFHEEERRLDGVLRGLSATKGQEFFRALAQSLAEALDVRYVFIGELINDSATRLRPIAFWQESDFGHADGYDLADSPCDDPSTADFYRCASGLRERFPRDRFVRRFAADSFLGIPILSGSECLGYIVAFDSQPMRVRWFRDWILRIIAQLAGSEILRARTQTALEHARKMEAVGQLTGGIAHDFNNLLAVICGNLELLSKRVDDDGPELQEILRAASRGADLTQRLLAFARKQPLNAEPTDIRRLVTDMHPLIERTLGSAIHVETRVHEGPAVALVDPSQLESAILNLAINSRDAMPGGGTLVVETGILGTEETRRLCGDESAARPGVIISVHDDGEGMTENELSRAFEPFFTTKPKGDGNGLGLSMVYGFARQTGGTAIIESTVGSGTIAKLVLPQVDEPAAAVLPERVIDPPRGHGETVLAVEDDPSVRRYVTRALEELGYLPLHATNVSAARKILKTEEVAVLLSDILLPGEMNGSDLAREALGRTSRLGVILMSGYPSELETTELGERVQFLSKPFTSSALAAALHEALRP